MALRLAERFDYLQTTKKERGLSCDEGLLILAQRLTAIVLTNDRELLKRLGVLGLTTISLRSRTHLVLNEGCFLDISKDFSSNKFLVLL